MPAERGSQEVALPEPDSSYVVELAVMQNYQWVVLARSDVVHAPPDGEGGKHACVREPCAAAAPAG